MSWITPAALRATPSRGRCGMARQSRLHRILERNRARLTHSTQLPTRSP